MGTLGWPGNSGRGKARDGFLSAAKGAPRSKSSATQANSTTSELVSGH